MKFETEHFLTDMITEFQQMNKAPKRVLTLDLTHLKLHTFLTPFPFQGQIRSRGIGGKIKI